MESSSLGLILVTLNDSFKDNIKVEPCITVLHQCHGQRAQEPSIRAGQKTEVQGTCGLHLRPTGMASTMRGVHQGEVGGLNVNINSQTGGS